ncbi:ABC transporter ATP-binding protein [Liquorilactobacillus mali]|uniref:ABC superfamily ATP binding cassette transporter, ABC protein n=1 Tax=Liquorilactobacillus mali TaxID=1618 RepID=A0A0R2FN33_9LACO|nr:ABC transporter ATP-binding protein [Liquorilactobacillus mali]KRN29993.1 ABC superfamily ATP binding cassette transporter, ABC protein [Liquorilactobacillus mali]MDN7144781.1 ABC transporter ATP-binding protein [Liquorilactobacillus mali]
MKQIISVKNLNFSYGETEILKKINLTINKGEIIGLIGENGAGKTTLLNILLGLLPSKNNVQVFGNRPGSLVARKKIGSMLQGDLVLSSVRVDEFLEEVAMQYSNSIPLEQILEQLDLKKHRHKFLKELSGGLMRRVTFAQAVLNNPDLIFLDEPTVGMDAQARHIFWELIEKLREQGKTMIITSHYLEEIQQVASRLIVLQKGKFIFQGTLKELQDRHKQTVITFTSEYEKCVFAELTGIINIEKNSSQVVIKTVDGDNTLKQLLSKYPDVSNIAVEHETLEKIFLQMTTDKEQQ